MIEVGYLTGEAADNEIRSALVVAHPGHELCLYGWLKLARPKVFVLTDGSGNSSTPRIERTTDIVKEVGADIGTIYGRLSDTAIYEALLNHQFDLFTNLAHELAHEFVNARINYVVGDASDGYNPTHDICRMVLDAAVEIARRKNGKTINRFEYLMPGRPESRHRSTGAQVLRVELEEAVFERKLEAARRYLELKDEIEALTRTCPETSFRSELLYPVNNDEEPLSHLMGRYYEEYGEMRVKQGLYKQVIRYEEHVRPLETCLRQVAKKSP